MLRESFFRLVGGALFWMLAVHVANPCRAAGQGVVHVTATTTWPEPANAAPANTAPPAATADLPPPEATEGYATARPSGNNLGFSSVNVSGPYIALTFDDGPHPTNTPRLLDLLAERGVKATFFVVGTCAQEYPEIMRRIAAEGHEVANHSWSHPAFAKMSDAAVRSQIERTQRIIQETTGMTASLLRPPYGSITRRQQHWIQDSLNLRVVLWSVDPLDWRKPGPSVVTRRIVEGTQPGAIILAHDIHPQTIAAMPATIDQLLAKGFQFVTVSQLLAMEVPPAPKPTPALQTAAAVAPAKKAVPRKAKRR